MLGFSAVMMTILIAMFLINVVIVLLVLLLRVLLLFALVLLLVMMLRTIIMVKNGILVAIKSALGFMVLGRGLEFRIEGSRAEEGVGVFQSLLSPPVKIGLRKLQGTAEIATVVTT